MKIELEVDAQALEELTKGTIENLSEEAKLEIVKEGLIKTLTNVDSLDKILNTGTYYNNGKEGLRKLIYQAADKIDLSPLFEEVKTKITEYVKEKGQDLAKEYLMSRFTKGLMNTFDSDQTLRDMIRRELYQVVEEKRGNNGF